jgi:hypothetical protein
VTAEGRLRLALQAAIDELLSVVGTPADPEAEDYGPRVQVDEPLVDPEQVPGAAWRAACFALDVLEVGLGVLDNVVAPIGPDEGLALLLRRAEGAS